MMNSEPKRLCGRYLAENKDDFLKAYHIVVDVKETDKSYIMQLVEFNSRYSASHISLLFSKSKRVVLSKKKGGFAIRSWSDDSFTFYPFQAGTPYYFEKLPGTAVRRNILSRKSSLSRMTALNASPRTAPITGTASAAFPKSLTGAPLSPRRTAARNLSSVTHTEHRIAIRGGITNAVCRNQTRLHLG